MSDSQTDRQTDVAKLIGAF